MPFSFTVEHCIKVGTQGVMEEAMFEFCQKYAPAAMRQAGWTSPDMSELNIFAQLLLQKEHSRTAAQGINRSMDIGWRDFIATLESLKNLRHTAVHRRSVGERGLEHMLTDCVVLLEAVQDPRRHAKVSAIRAMVKKRDWENSLRAVDTPVGSFRVLPFYGKPFQSIDLTDDDPSQASVPQEREVIDLTG